VHCRFWRLHSKGRFCSVGGHEAEEAVLLTIGVLAASSAAGLLVGLRFRAPALLAASAAAVAVGAWRGVAGDWPPGWTLLLAFGCVMALQLGYLAALFGAGRHRY
jgi:hypothetical protein